MMEQITSRVTLHSGDCLDILPTLAECSIDSCVTDPPYGLTSGGNKGFMGKEWDAGVPGVAFWREVYRVLKPGAHLVAFGGSRTYHRMACAIEDAGFEIRDSLMWVYGVGFPKSHNVAVGIDKAKSLTSARGKGFNAAGIGESNGGSSLRSDHPDYVPYVPQSLEAAEWQGWGTALKPAFEPIVLARKPLSESTVAANVLRWRTGALNIDGCRIGTEILPSQKAGQAKLGTFERENMVTPEREGRWPANVCHDGSAEVVAAFPTNKSPQPRKTKRSPDAGNRTGYGTFNGQDEVVIGFGDSGSAARFFYSAKASKADRAGSKHPTVKPVSLKEWLAVLITPPGGTILDPFAGSGTTGAAARNKGFNCVLIEREAEYQQDIRNRFATSADLLEAAE